MSPQTRTVKAATRKLPFSIRHRQYLFKSWFTREFADLSQRQQGKILPRDEMDTNFLHPYTIGTQVRTHAYTHIRSEHIHVYCMNNHYLTFSARDEVICLNDLTT